MYCSVHGSSTVVGPLLLCVKVCFWRFVCQTSAVAEAQKLMVQAADLLSAIHTSLHHGIQAQNGTTKGGNSPCLLLLVFSYYIAKHAIQFVLTFM